MRQDDIRETSSFLADSPKDFADCFSYVPISSLHKAHPYFITNAGLQITGRIQPRPDEDNYGLLLPCHDEDPNWSRLILKIYLKL
jgi:hypothetical protein